MNCVRSPYGVVSTSAAADAAEPGRGLRAIIGVSGRYPGLRARPAIIHSTPERPGRCCVLFAETDSGTAFWVTSWPFAEFVQHEWPGAWVCSAFRNEGAGVASELIRQAVAATRSVLGEPPELGMITFIDRSQVRPTRVRGRDVWGWTYRRAGFEEVGETKGGLLALRLSPEAMPAAQRPLLELEWAA